MSCWIRKRDGDELENYRLLGEDDWDLQSLFDKLESWLSEVDGNLPAATSWIVDVGFSHRHDATGGGPVLSAELMQLCLRNKIEVYLSEYDLASRET